MTMPGRYHALCTLPLLLIVSVSIVHAQPKLAQPYTFQGNIWDIAFRNSVNGCALGDQTVWKTTDAGVSWTPTIPLAFRPEFKALALFGDDGIIIGDAIGDVHWTVHPDSLWNINEGTGDPVIAIEAVDRDHWVVLTPSVVRSTTDGGKTFHEFTPENSAGFSSLDITDASLMHVTEYTYKVWRSTDGGATWSKLPGPRFEFGILHDVRFVSPDTGFVASWYPWNLFTTTDGGATWTTGQYEYPLSIAAERGGVGAYATRDFLRVSDDGGLTWSDSLTFADAFPDRTYERVKLITAGEGSIFLLLTAPEESRSVVVRVERVSSVRQRTYPSPAVEFDLSMLNNRN